MNWWTLLWACWGGLFLLIELPAARDHIPGNTASELIWRFIGRGESKTAAIRLRRAVFVSGFAILGVHLLTGWI